MQQQFLCRLTLGCTRKLTPPRRGGGGNLTPPRRFWYVAVLQIDFTFSGKPLIFLTRRGQFYGWWHCWRPVTSPAMVAILAAILKTWEDLRFIVTQIKKPGHWMHQQFLCSLSLGCTRKLTPPRRGGRGFQSSPKFLICCSITNRFYL